MCTNPYGKRLWDKEAIYFSRFVAIFIVILVLVSEINSLPLTLHSPAESHVLDVLDDNSVENLQFNKQQQQIKIREKDKSVLRAIAIFIGSLLLFSIVICFCAMYWCLCWTLDCPGVSTIRNLFQSTRNTRRVRPQHKSKIKMKGKYADLPPTYECIMTTSDQPTISHSSNENEMPPPTYMEAVCKNKNSET